MLPGLLPSTTLEPGTILVHERDTLFPGGRKFPFYIYNWYSGKPFWAAQKDIEEPPHKSDYPLARYIYRVRNRITNLFPWDENLYGPPNEEDPVATLDTYLHKIWPGYKEGTPEDYSQAAFIIQVLGYSGMLSLTSKGAVDVLVLRDNAEDYLDLVKVLKFGDPPVHPGYTTLEPEGPGVPPASKRLKNPTRYTRVEIDTIRHEIRNGVEEKKKADISTHTSESKEVKEEKKLASSVTTAKAKTEETSLRPHYTTYKGNKYMVKTGQRGGRYIQVGNARSGTLKKVYI